ncbi:MAG: DUF5666 domain-containing protein [Rhodothermales bacterium]|nr:DUF5666 domain-containing protein [Rhodothermales bacterium]
MKRIPSILSALVVLLLGFQLAGCDALESINPFDNEKEVTGTVEAVDAASLTVDGISYAVTDNTKFDGYADLSEVSVGDKVEVEYEERNGGREAKEVEPAD